jgi:putative ABC transport system permease protein
MLKNQIIIAIRTLLKNKLYSIINISGLTIGLACSICIFIFVKDELSYDRYHPNADRIFRVIQDGAAEHSATLPFPAGPAFQNEFGDLLESYTRVFNFQASSLPIVYDNDGDRKTFNEPRFFFGDSTFFKVFNFKFIKGNPATCLNGPNLVVITESTAARYFGYHEPIGKTISFEGMRDMTVSGVIQDVPENSHFRFDFMASFTSLNTLRIGRRIGPPDRWYWNPVWTYLLLKDVRNVDQISAQFPRIVHKYFDEALRDRVELVLQPLTDIYLKSNSDFEINTMSDIKYVYIFSILGVAILFVACINFINLTTARSAERFKEIGVRKVMGAFKANLIFQFISESMVISTIAYVLAFGITILLIPILNYLTGKALTISVFVDLRFVIASIAIVFFVGVISGVYPSFILSAQDAVKILKPNTGKFSGSALLRKALVVFQFVVSMIFISGTIIAYRQIHYMRDASLGFDRDQIIVIPSARTSIVPKFEAFKDALLQNSGIVNVTAAHAVVGRDHETNNYKKQGDDDMVTYPVLVVRNDFIKTFGGKILAGHDFTEEYTDTLAKTIINKVFMEKMGWKKPEEAIGQVLDAASEGMVTVVGVCDNFHYASLKQPIGPLLMVQFNRFDPVFTKFIYVKIKPENYQASIEYMRSQWERFVNESPFNFFFLNDNLNTAYRKEEKFNEITSAFAFIAIGIGAMGLFGLAAFTAQKRKKEICIRKVNGATSNSVMFLLLREFLMLIAIAGVIAVPLSWYLMDRWLSSFAFRINIGFIVFVIGLLAVTVTAMLTTSYQVFKASRVSPALALRSE